MKGQVLKILFKDDMAFLTKEVALDFNQVDISPTPVRFQAPAFWVVKVIAYIQEQNRLFVEVLDYRVGEAEFSADQLELNDTLISIEEVSFKNIDTRGLLGTLYSKEPARLLPVNPDKFYRRDTQLQHELRIKSEQQRATFTELFSIPIKNVMFLSGEVRFEKKVDAFKKPIKFKILNENIIEEFDAIKNYFASVLHTKKIQVVATIETLDGEIIETKATSVEIDKIDKTTVEEVKFEIVKTIRKKEPTGEKQLFTMEEYLETYAEAGLKGEAFFKDDSEFFESMLKMTHTKHYKHLRFLSGRHRSDILKLRFIHKPFAYVFLLSGSDNFYIIWETHNTQEATYIWTTKKDTNILKQILPHIDETIKLIKIEGKNDYINRNEENFSRVYHDYTDLENGFKRWKDEIEKIVQ